MTRADVAFRKFQISKFDRAKSIASVTIAVDIDVARALALRAEWNEANPSARVSVGNLLLKAVADTLVDFPVMYSFFDGRRIIPNEEIVLNVPVDIENHVEYIVLREPERMSLQELAAESGRQLEQIRAGEGAFRATVERLVKVPGAVRRWVARHTRADVRFCRRHYGNFVVSNAGALGVDQIGLVSSMPLIAVLGVARVRPWPVEENGGVVMKPHVNACLTFDHRPMDGGLAARFLSRLRETLESPEALFGT